MLSHQDLNRHVGRYYGKYSGEVIDNADSLKLGRVQVSVPTVFGSEMPVWARPCFPAGHFWVPPIGAKVWVEFEAGDPGYPLWVGTWYPDGTVPPEAALSPPDARVLHTPGGHVVELLDTAGEEKVIIRHKSGAFVSIDKNGSVLIANKEGSHLHLDAEKGSATWMEQHGNLVSMGEKGVVVVNKDGTTLEMKDGKVKVIAADGVQIEAKDVAMNVAGATIGKDAMEPAVLGQQLNILWTALMLHTHPSAMGPTGPAVGIPALTPALSLAVKVK